MTLLIFRAVIPIAGLTILLVLGEQVSSPAKYGQNIHGASQDQIPAIGQTALEPGRPIDAEVQSENLDIIDRPDDKGFITGRLHRGDRLLVRPDHSTATGWLTIVPPPTAICWIEQSSLESGDEVTGAIEHDRAGLAWVSSLEASIRSGHPQARLPGPPVGILPKGTMVQLVDRPPLSIGQGSKASRWLAIVPPADQVSYVRALGVRWSTPARPVPPAVLARASYEEPMQPGQAARPQSGSSPASSSWSPEIAAELQRIDGIYQVIIASQPIEQWRFETVRASYQALLKRSGDQEGLEEALRKRLNRLTRHEQAARAARTIEAILADSHRRDREVAAVRKDLARLERTRARGYDAVGFIQPSARKVDGHKVFALIGGQGSTIAYLDIPPGLDPQPLLARRVGVRGQTHWSEDLGTRLITVRDMESIEARK
jgi:hypothetical protein